MTLKGQRQPAEAVAKSSVFMKGWWANPESREFTRKAQLEAVKGRVYPERECATCGVPFQPTNSTGTNCELHRRKRRDVLCGASSPLDS